MPLTSYTIGRTFLVSTISRAFFVMLYYYRCRESYTYVLLTLYLHVDRPTPFLEAIQQSLLPRNVSTSRWTNIMARICCQHSITSITRFASSGLLSASQIFSKITQSSSFIAAAATRTALRNPSPVSFTTRTMIPLFGSVGNFS